MPFELPFSTVEAMVAFLLVFFRMTGMTLSAPLFSNDSFPMQLRIWVAFFLSLLVFPLVWAQTPEGIFTGVFRHPASAALAVAGEIAVGWVLGWTASIIVWVAQLAGHFIGQDIGLSLGDVFDPISESNSSPIALFFFTLALLAFVLMDGHHQVILAVARSFQVAPPGSFPLTSETSLFLVRDLGGEIWRTGLQLALPSMVALLIVTVAMAVLARAVPEMNVFILGFAVRIVVGFLSFLVVLPLVPEVFGKVMEVTSSSLERLLTLWGGG